MLDSWDECGETLPLSSKKLSPAAHLAYMLLSAHLLRIRVPASLSKSACVIHSVSMLFDSLNSSLSHAVQSKLLHQIPTLLNSQLSMALGHNWFPTSRNVMHLTACFAQAVPPTSSPLLQFPGVTPTDLQGLRNDDLAKLLERLDTSKDERADSIRLASRRWGKLDVVNAKLKGMCLYITPMITD